MTNRATRGLELFSDFEQISFDEAWELKHDNSYSVNYRGIAFLSEVIALPTASDTVSRAIEILETWDLGTDKENRGAALGVCVLAAEWQAESGGTSNPDAHKQFLTIVLIKPWRLVVVLIRAGVMSIDMVEMGHTGQLPEALTRCARSILDGLMETTI